MVSNGRKSSLNYCCSDGDDEKWKSNSYQIFDPKWNPLTAWPVCPIFENYRLKWTTENEFMRDPEIDKGTKSTDDSLRTPIMDPVCFQSDMINAIEWIAKERGGENGLDNPFLGQKRINRYGEISFGYESYRTSLSKSSKLANYLLDNALVVKQNYKDPGHPMNEPLKLMAISMRNRREYFYAEYACQMAGAVLVPIYPSLDEKSLESIIEETKISVLLVDCESLLALINRGLSPTKFPKNIIVTEDVEDRNLFNAKDQLSRLERAGVIVHHLSNVINSKAKELSRNLWHQWKDEEIWTICYTSGTSGRPKGVLITQGAMLKSAINVVFSSFADCKLHEVFLDIITQGEENVYFSYLPMAHIFERVSVFASISMGFKVATYNGPIDGVLTGLRASHCSLFIAVPRILERIYKEILKALNGRSIFAKTLATAAVAWKIRAYETDGSLESPLFDSILMNKVKDKIIGSSVKAVMSGGAPMNDVVKKTLQAFFSVPILGGYGMTETTSGIFVQHTKNLTTNCGHPMPSIEFKLIDVPDLNLASTEFSKEGELCIRGDIVTPGYFCKPDLTKKLFTDDGYIMTGDVVRVSEEGMEIIGRSKSLLKLSQGEYVAVESVENKIDVMQNIQQIIITGKSTNNYCIGLIALKDFDGSGETELSTVINNDVLQELEEIKDRLRTQAVSGYEIPRYFAVMNRPLTIQDNCITPTLKLRRYNIDFYFSNIINDIYKHQQHIYINVDKILKGLDG